MTNIADAQSITMDTVHASTPFLKSMIHHDEPTYPEMAVIQKEIYQNLMAITSPFGDGQTGFISILRHDALYAKWFNKTFDHHKPRRIPSQYSNYCISPAM